MKQERIAGVWYCLSSIDPLTLLSSVSIQPRINVLFPPLLLPHLPHLRVGAGVCGGDLPGPGHCPPGVWQPPAGEVSGRLCCSLSLQARSHHCDGELQPWCAGDTGGPVQLYLWPGGHPQQLHHGGPSSLWWGLSWWCWRSALWRQCCRSCECGCNMFFSLINAKFSSLNGLFYFSSSQYHQKIVGFCQSIVFSHISKNKTEKAW